MNNKYYFYVGKMLDTYYILFEYYVCHNPGNILLYIYYFERGTSCKCILK